LTGVLAELGTEHVLFSTDHPYESMREVANWFDNAPISETGRQMIGRDNAKKPFKLPA
jgi:2,3-dihydroxybenzoate decarboxylase